MQSNCAIVLILVIGALEMCASQFAPYQQVPLNPYFGQQLECYVGVGYSYSLQSCARVCGDGVACSCAKVENADGRGNDARDCWANPHRAQAAGCQYQFYNQQYRTVCTCSTPMCNASYKTNAAFALIVSAAAVVGTLQLYNN